MIHIYLTCFFPQGGLLGYKRDRGVRRSLIFCTQKNTWTLYCTPKKIQDWKLFKSYFRILRELWLELRKNYWPGGNLNPKNYVQIFQTQKNTRLNLQPKKIQELKILDPKDTLDPPHPPPPPPVTFIPAYPTWGFFNQASVH